MAAVFETVTIPRLSSTISISLVSALSCCRRSVRLPQSRGLKINCVSIYNSRVSPRSRLAQLGDRIVCEAQETSIEVPDIDNDTWNYLVLESTSPVLVEFWAPWCGPCRMIHPVIDELAKEYVGKLKCYRVNTDESPTIASKYGIRSIPTVIIFMGGEKKDAIIGAVPKTTLATSIENGRVPPNTLPLQT